MIPRRRWVVIAAWFCVATPTASAFDLRNQIDERASSLERQVIEWRRDIHQHPELSNREFRTAALVAKELPDGGRIARPSDARISTASTKPVGRRSR